MPPDTLPPVQIKGWWPPALSPAWHSALIKIGGSWLVLIALFGADWAEMVDQWWNSSTYNHVLLIPLIIGWLIWQRVPELAKISPGPAWIPGLLLFSGAAFLWVLGALAGVATARQAGAVGMLIAAAVTFLGPKGSAALAFPLGYMALLVPIGDEFIAPLQMITAALTIALVHLSNIPATIDGVFISTPAGLFEVAEACSGVKFLVAMVAFGVLVANVCFISWRRRAAFLLLCLLVPILANGVRAWGTVFAAQYVGAQAATGLDHIVYGWVFFAIVIALVMSVSWRWFDRPADDRLIDGNAIAASPFLTRLQRFTLSPLLAIAALAAVSLLAQAWAMAADRMVAALPKQIFLTVVPGWNRVDYAPHVWWYPRASGAQHRLLGRYRSTDGQHTVDVFFALYAAQHDGAEAGGFGEGALQASQGWSWQSPGPALAGAKVDRLLAEGRVSRLAETYFRVGDMLTGSNSRLKLATVADRLVLRERPTMLLILSAEDDPAHPAEAALVAFRKSTGSLGPWMDRMAKVR